MTSFQLAFDRLKNPWASDLYNALIKQGISPKQIDQGYWVIHESGKFCQPSSEPCYRGENDFRIEPQEVFKYALDNYEKYHSLLKGIVGKPLPWSLDDLDPTTKFDSIIREKVHDTIIALKHILSELGLKEGTSAYKEKMAVGLYYFCAMPDHDTIQSMGLYLFNQYTQELMDIGLASFKEYIRQNGGLYVEENNDKGEYSALEAIDRRLGECTEKSKILFAVYSMAGYEPKFIFIDPHGSTHFKMKDIAKNEPHKTHLCIALSFGEGKKARTRLFDPSLFVSDAGVFHKKYREYSRWLFFVMDYVNLGNVYTSTGEYDKAIAELNKALMVYPHSTHVYNSRGVAYEKSGNLKKAIENYNEAIELSPEYSSPYNNRGVAHALVNNFESAIDDFLTATKKQPPNYTAFKNLGRAYYDTEKYDQAVEAYEKASKMAPRHAAELHFSMGEAYFAKGDNRRAIEEYGRSIRIDPDNARIRSKLGIAYIRIGKLDLAVGEFREARRIDPQCAEAHFGLGIIYAKEGESSLAIKEFRRVVEIDSTHAGAHFNLGLAYLGEGELILAVREFERTIEIDSNNFPKVHNALGVANYKIAMKLMREGKIGEAISRLNKSKVYFENSLKLNPDDLREKKNIEMVESKLHDLQMRHPNSEAKTRTTIKEGTPDLVKRYCSLGDEYYKKNELTKALSYYKKAVEINPKSEQAWLGIWNTYKVLGDEENARKACEKYKHLTGAPIPCE